ncbi:MAG: YqaA family protein [Desulfovibrionaceae bacterium]
MKLFKSWMDRLWAVAATKGAGRVLALVAFTESIFFPVPPDLLLIPMALARRERAFRLAGLCLGCSVLGGMAGYAVGYFFMETLGMPIVRFYGLMDKYGLVKEWYDAYSAWAVAVAGLTPIPYKLCTLTAGAFKIDFLVFMVASTLARGVRFFCIAGLIWLFGEKVRFFLEKRFDLVALATAALVVIGFVALKYLH